MRSDARRTRSVTRETKENAQCVTGRSNFAKTCIGGASVRNAEKVENAGQKAECVKTIKTDVLMKLKKKSKNLSVKVFS